MNRFPSALLCVLAACAPAPSPVREAGGVIHLTDRLAQAESEVAAPSAGTPISWDLAAADPGWSTLGSPRPPRLASVAVTPLDDGLRLAFSRPDRPQGLLRIGGLSTSLDGLRLADWDRVLVRARSHQRFVGLTVAYNLDEEGALPTDDVFFFSTDQAPPVFSDGSVQTYSIPLRRRPGDDSAELRNLAVVAATPEDATIDLLSVSLVPHGSAFSEAAGAVPLARGGTVRDTLYAHTPARLAWSLEPGTGTRFDVGLTADPGEELTYRVSAAAGEEVTVLLESTLTGEDEWSQETVDLSRWADRPFELVLEAEAPVPGAVALWGAPVVSASRRARRPNVVFYVIDGGGADYMSLYGYNRRTTPFLEELAAEGTLFEHAYSNATWTQPSTASFMTSLHHSVLGGLSRGVHSTPVPASATTMAEHMRRGGYQTASFTSNPNAGRIIGLQRGVDMMRDVEDGHHSTSSSELHERFWRFRELYPGAPWWVHFQTTDVHEPNEPAPPFSGLFASAEERARLAEWDGAMWRTSAPLFGTTSIVDFYDRALAAANIDRQAYFGLRRDLYDETMAYQDEQLRRFVSRLKAEGEWENTLFILGADHGHPAGTFARFGHGLLEPQPPQWQGALFDSYATHVPLLVVWPGHVEAGARFEQAVSMIDVLPTILDLVGLERPEVLQGQSLAPLLTGGSMEVRPVVFDEFRVDEEDRLIGNLEIVDGRWGASLQIGPEAPNDPGATHGRLAVPAGGRWAAHHPYFDEAPRLLLFDLWNDPFTTHAVNDRHPELVERYRRQLLELWQAHRALAGRFASDGGEVPLTPDQLEQLKALGYIQ
ncbi:MAG: sulfatase [Thermoanaerobaculia bacterium]